MSLVSYDWGSSDEEGENEDEHETKPTVTEPARKTDGISSALTSSLQQQPSPDPVASSSSDSSTEREESSETTFPKFVSSKEEFALPNFLEKGLKPMQYSSEPLPLPAGFASVDENEEEIIEVEDTPFDPSILLAESKKRKAAKKVATQEKGPKSIGSLFSALNPPWELDTDTTRNKNRKQKSKESVKISIPSAPEVYSDEEDEPSPSVKKLKPSESGTGLSLLLPKPKHSISFGKTVNPNKPFTKQTARPLIPYTLSKKKVDPIKTQLKPKPAEDDDDEEPVSFFSFVEKPTHEDIKTEAEIKPLLTTSISANYGAGEATTDKPVTTADNTAYEYTSHPSASTYGTYTQSDTGQQQGAESADWYGMQEQQTPIDDQEATTTYYYPSYSGQFQNEKEEPSGGSSTGSTSSLDMDQIMKLQGRRGKREVVDIVDVNCDDHLAPSNEWIKQVSEERAQFSAKKKDGDMPSTQTKRKHQITYLAFQAKERELELRNQWANNRSSQRQSQSKYGF